MKLDHPDRDEDRQPDEHARDQVAPQARRTWSCRRATVLAARPCGLLADFLRLGSRRGLLRACRVRLSRGTSAALGAPRPWRPLAALASLRRPCVGLGLLARRACRRLGSTRLVPRCRRGCACFSLSALKSVSYQPPPFRRNTGADTSFFSCVLAALRALAQRLVADLLHHLELVAAGLALVFVERHSPDFASSRAGHDRATRSVIKRSASRSRARAPAARQFAGDRPRQRQAAALLHALVEAELAVLGAPTRMRSPGHELAVQDALRQRVLDLLLDRALQRPRAVHRIEARLAEQVARRVDRARARCRARARRLRRYASWMSTIARICSRPSGWNTTMSSMRLMNSGRNAAARSPSPRPSSRVVVLLARELLDHAASRGSRS